MCLGWDGQLYKFLQRKVSRQDLLQKAIDNIDIFNLLFHIELLSLLHYYITYYYFILNYYYYYIIICTCITLLYYILLFHIVISIYVIAAGKPIAFGKLQKSYRQYCNFAVCSLVNLYVRNSCQQAFLTNKIDGSCVKLRLSWVFSEKAPKALFTTHRPIVRLSHWHIHALEKRPIQFYTLLLLHIIWILTMQVV